MSTLWLAVTLLALVPATLAALWAHRLVPRWRAGEVSALKFRRLSCLRVGIAGTLGSAPVFFAIVRMTQGLDSFEAWAWALLMPLGIGVAVGITTFWTPAGMGIDRDGSLTRAIQREKRNRDETRALDKRKRRLDQLRTRR